MVSVDSLLLLDRVVLAATFGVAAFGKITDQEGTRRALAEFGVPEALVGPGSLVLPTAEVAILLGLLVDAFATWAGAGALVLLLVFLAAVAFNLSRGRTPDCHCFGQIRSEPIGARTVVLNLILSLLAGVLFAIGSMRSPTRLFGWAADLTGGERAILVAGAAIAAALAGVCFLMWQMLLQQGRILLRLESLEAVLGEESAAWPASQPRAAGGLAGRPIGAPAPRIELADKGGQAVSVDALLRPGKPLILLFTNPTCGPCQALLPQVRGWRKDLTAARLVLCVEGGGHDLSEELEPIDLHPVLLQEGRSGADAYEAWGTPSAVLIRPDGSIGSGVAAGADAIRDLVEALNAGLAPNNPFQVVRRAQPVVAPAAPTGLPVGEPAPAIGLPNASGGITDVASVKDRDTVLLFWNPGCGFCASMVDDLKRFDADAAERAPRLLVISTGTAETAKAMGLRATILLDPEMSVSRLYGAGGTPMAVKLDTSNRIASPLAVGAAAVLGLLKPAA